MRWAWFLLLALFLVHACAGPGLSKALKKRFHLQFEGRSSFSEKELSAVVARELETESPLGTKAQIDDAAFALENLYLEHGHPFARVDYDFDQPGEGPAQVRFRIEEGPRTRIEELRLEGATAFPQETLQAFFEDVRENEIFIRSKLNSAVRAVEDHYFEHGFMEASVGDPVLEFHDEGERVSIRLVIAEGQRFVLKEVRFEGGELLIQQREALARGYLDRPFVPRIAEELRARVRELYGGNGFPDCQVKVDSTIDSTSGEVRLAVQVEPGERVTIARIRIEGAERARKSWILEQLAVEAGKPYDSGRLNEGFERLYGTGVFSSVRIYLEEREGPERTLVVQVEEEPTLEFSVEPGWGSYEGPRLKLELDRRNLFGTGKQAALETTVSPKAQGTRLSLTDPWFLKKELVAKTSLFFNRREEPSFTTSDVGMDFQIRKNLGNRWDGTVGYEFRASRLEDVQVGAIVPEEALEDVDIGSIFVTLGHDRRNDLIEPKSGSRSRYRLEWASEVLASQIDFLAGDIDWMYVVPLAEPTTLATSLRLGVTAPLHGTETLPLQVRRFNGGENTVRSFAEDELGPKDANGDPIGGEAFQTVSLELRQVIAGNFSGALFFDAGNVTPEYEDTLRFQGFRTGLGVGLRYSLPIGPLRVDLGWNPDPEQNAPPQPDEDDFVLHFAIGLPF